MTPRYGSVLFALILLLAAAPSWGNEILVSSAPDRSAASPLEGAVVDGEVYIFFETSSTPESVEFFIDGTLEATDKKAPYDLAGGKDTALPYDTAKNLDDGSHLLEVLVAVGDSAETFIATFEVANAAAPLDPGSEVRVTGAVADLENRVLTLVGHNFDAGSAPEVALGLVPIIVSAYTGATIEAQLPDDLTPGDYLLNVTIDGSLVPGLNDKDHVETILTVASRDHAELLNIGSSSHEDLDALIAGLQGSFTALEATVTSQSQIIADLGLELQAAQSTIATLEGQLAAVEADVAANGSLLATAQADIGLLEARPIFDLEPYVEVTDESLELLEGPHVIFRGANVHIQSGSGATNDGGGEPLGLGNLIVGYNEHVTGPHTGSHNLVLGSGNQYSSYGGLITGFRNRSFGPGGVLIGGYQNTATGANSVVVGGQYGVADGMYSAIAGGVGNSTSVNGYAAYVAGGEDNAANAHMSSILGGFETVNSRLRGTIADGVIPSQLGQSVEALNGTVTTVAALADTNAAGLLTAEQAILGLQTDVGQLDSAVAAQVSELTTVQSDLDLAEASLASLVSDMDAVELTLSDLQASSIFDLEPYVEVSNDALKYLQGPHVIFKGANVHVQSGSGATDDSGNLLGLGNLIVGYNDDVHVLPGTRTGSHNLILGASHRYTSWGGIVSGSRNNLAAAGGALIGGYANRILGSGSTVLGGQHNEARGLRTSIGGGEGNETEGVATFVAGGASNLAQADLSAILGGESNWTYALKSSISGGFDNTTRGINSSIGGGTAVNLGGTYAWEAGSVGTSLANFEQDILTLQADMGAVQATASQNTSDLLDIFDSSIFDLQDFVAVEQGSIHGLAGPHVLFSGANVHVRSGSGNTDDGGGATWGLGNLIVGYNEEHPDYLGVQRTGSHNLIVGPEHRYTSYSGFVASSNNSISAPFATVTGGAGNSAEGNASSVAGGAGGRATGPVSTICGGRTNVASAYWSTASGGEGNTAEGEASSAFGGQWNISSEFRTTAVGGTRNAASGQFTLAAGGADNTAYAPASAVVGGQYNVAPLHNYSSIVGGYGNRAEASHSAICGGFQNTSVAGAYQSTVLGGVQCSLASPTSTMTGQTCQPF